MSDYLTRLVERSLGLAPRIEPLIAPINAPSDQVLSQTAATSAAFELDAPAGKIETSQHDTSADRALNATGVETKSQTGTLFPQAPSPPPASQTEARIEKRDDRIHPTELRASAPSLQTPSASNAEVVGITATTAPDSPLSPRPTPIVSRATPRNVVQPKIIEHPEPAAAPEKSQLVVRPEIVQSEIIKSSEPAAAPKEPPLSPRTTTTAPNRATQMVVPPEIISPLRPAASSLVPALESSATEQSLPSSATTAASRRTTKTVVQPASTSLVAPTVSPLFPVRQPPSNEPPVIHVTIGRVEVRAIMPPATPKVAPPAAPKLSLEEYLKQRNGRAR